MTKEKWESVKRAVFCFAGLAILFLFLVAVKFRCPVKEVIGLPCPGCGLTRACLRALQFDFSGASQMHPLFWLGPPVLFLALWKRGEVLPGRWNTVFWVGTAILFLGVYFARMAVLFPDTPPLDADLAAPGAFLWRRLLL